MAYDSGLTYCIGTELNRHSPLQLQLCSIPPSPSNPSFESLLTPRLPSPACLLECARRLPRPPHISPGFIPAFCHLLLRLRGRKSTIRTDDTAVTESPTNRAFPSPSFTLTGRTHPFFWLLKYGYLDAGRTRYVCAVCHLWRKAEHTAPGSIQ